MAGTIAFEPVRWDASRITVRTNLRRKLGSRNSTLHRLFNAVPGMPINVDFSFSEDLKVSGSTLANALSTLAGNKYERIHFGFEVAEDTRLRIAEWTCSEVSSEGTESFSIGETSGTVLNFSGGFDSLAARFLLPEDTKLVSMDLGGAFARESRFFEQFDPLIVQTNVIDTPLRYNSWSFIGMGALFANETYKHRYNTFGSVFEATELIGLSGFEKNLTFPPFKIIGLENAPTIQGLSEAGSVAVLAHFAPELIGPSLQSVANPKEEKLFRKWAIATATLQALGKEAQLPSVIEPDHPHFTMGENFVVDLSALLVAWLGRPDLAKKMVRGFTSAIESDVKALDLSFLMKANQGMYSRYPKEIRPYLDRGVEASGLDWYTSPDWVHRDEIRAYILSLQDKLN